MMMVRENRTTPEAHKNAAKEKHHRDRVMSMARAAHVL